MNISLFTDWLEERLFGEGELAHLIADIVDEAMARDTPGELNPSERAEEGMLESAWHTAETENEAIRARTAIVLGRLGYRPVEEELEKAWHLNDSSIAGAAVIVLARLRGVDEGLLESLTDTVGDPATPRELRSAAAKAIASSDRPAAVEALVDIARSDDADLAQYGLEGLGVSKPDPCSGEHEDALQALLAGLKAKDPMLQAVAAEALGNFGDTVAIRDLEMILIEKDPTLRRRALFALAKLGAESARAPLTRMLRDVSIPARWEIVDLIGSQYGDTMADALAAAAKDSDPEMRDHVVAALARINGPAATELLRQIAAADKDRFVREQAAAAVARCEARMAEAPPAPEPVAASAAPRPPAPQPATAGPPPPPPAAAFAPRPPGKLQPLYAPAGPPAAPGAPQAEPAKNIVERALEAMECTWRLDPQGYLVQIPMGSTNETITILLSELDYEDSPLYRFIVHCGPAQGAAYEAALRNNRALDYGSLAISNESGLPTFVLTETMLAGAATAAGVRKTLTSLAHSAAQLRGSPPS